MGQANSRGTSEKRKQMAEMRNDALRERIRGDQRLNSYVLANGIQKLATNLTKAGVIRAPQAQDLGI